MMRGYDFIWRLARPLLPLMLAWRARSGKEDAARLTERFGRYDHRDNLPDDPLWIHAVSVGETVAGIALAEAIRKTGETAPILMTTNTVTAAARVAALPASLGVTHLYQPLDHPDMVAAFLHRIRPRIGLFLESDFWPTLITATAASGVPVAFVSAQLSDRAAARWKKSGAKAKAVFGAARLVLAVDETQAQRFVSLGAAPEAVQVGGSLKLPVAAAKPDKSFVTMLRRAAGKRRIFLAASTHAGEEETVIKAAGLLGGGWFTVIAPRHPDRGGDVAALCEAAGMPGGRRSAGAKPTADDTLYIADTLGEMESLFSAADITFLGGSLVPLGGHNPVEPAAHGLPVLTGPHLFKNSAEFGALETAGVVTLVKDAAGIADAAKAVCADSEKLAAIASAGKAHAAKAGKRPANAARLCLELLASGT
ncbi:MAG: 3-deoxy-D-manno-octulosonic acid transferase [Candidatus Puniceispirillaceae bacterium]